METCEVSECKGKPRQGKPYCLAHIGELPYVRQVQEQLAASAVELDAVRRLGSKAVPADSVLAEDVLTHLAENGATSVRALRKAVFQQSSYFVAEAYVNSLAARGLVTKRASGKTTIVRCA